MTLSDTPPVSKPAATRACLRERFGVTPRIR